VVIILTIRQDSSLPELLGVVLAGTNEYVRCFEFFHGILQMEKDVEFYVFDLIDTLR
jgi:hypothetical protein